MHRPSAPRMVDHRVVRGRFLCRASCRLQSVAHRTLSLCRNRYRHGFHAQRRPAAVVAGAESVGTMVFCRGIAGVGFCRRHKVPAHSPCRTCRNPCPAAGEREAPPAPRGMDSGFRTAALSPGLRLGKSRCPARPKVVHCRISRSGRRGGRRERRGNREGSRAAVCPCDAPAALDDPLSSGPRLCMDGHDAHRSGPAADPAVQEILANNVSVPGSVHDLHHRSGTVDSYAGNPGLYAACSLCRGRGGVRCHPVDAFAGRQQGPEAVGNGGRGCRRLCRHACPGNPADKPVYTCRYAARRGDVAPDSFAAGRSRRRGDIHKIKTGPSRACSRTCSHFQDGVERHRTCARRGLLVPAEKQNDARSRRIRPVHGKPVCGFRSKAPHVSRFLGVTGHMVAN